MKKNTRNFNRRYAKEYNWGRSLFFMFFLLGVVYTYFNLYYNYKIIGRENIPPREAKKGKYIYAGNHVSILDPPMVAMAALCPVAFMAKKELFEPGEKLGWLVKRLGAFAVDRSKPEIATFKTVRDVVSTTWSLGIFPQGGTRPYGELKDVKKGFAVIAKAAKADVIPVAIAGWDGYPKFYEFKKRNVTIKIGKPISHKLSEDEILYKWSSQICEMADYKNTIPNPATSTETTQKETINC